MARSARTPIPGADDALHEILRWATEPPWRDGLEEIGVGTLAGAANLLGTNVDGVREALGDMACEVAFGFAAEIFVAQRHDDGRTVIDHFLTLRGAALPAPARAYVEGFRDAVTSLYAIESVPEPERLTVRDLVRGGPAVTVEAHGASALLAEIAHCAMRVVAVDGRLLAATLIPLDAEIVEAAQGLIGKLRAAPEIQDDPCWDLAGIADPTERALRTAEPAFVSYWLSALAVPADAAPDA